MRGATLPATVDCGRASLAGNLVKLFSLRLKIPRSPANTRPLPCLRRRSIHHWILRAPHPIVENDGSSTLSLYPDTAAVTGRGRGAYTSCSSCLPLSTVVNHSDRGSCRSCRSCQVPRMHCCDLGLPLSFTAISPIRTR